MGSQPVSQTAPAYTSLDFHVSLASSISNRRITEAEEEEEDEEEEGEDEEEGGENDEGEGYSE